MKILIVDDHALFREGLVLLLKDLDHDLRVLQAGSVADAVDQLEGNVDVEVVLLDMFMPGRGGIDLLAEVKGKRPWVPVVILSADERVSTVTAAIERGASGYIPKTSTGEVMREALKLVLAGGIYLPPALLRDSSVALPSEPPAGAGVSAPVARQLGITARQADVLNCLLVGMPTKVIASKLKLSESTVKIHIMAIFRALKVHNRTEAVIEASRRGVQLGSQPARTHA